MYEGKPIGLYNYNAHRVFVKTQNRPQGIAIQAYEDGQAGVERFSFDEVRFINQTSAVIRNGILRIEEEDEEEVKKLLGIYGVNENDWTPEEIRDCVLNPTPSKLESLKEITSTATLDSFISVIMAEEEKKEFLISDHVREIITARKEEILNNVMKSKIEVVKKTAPPKDTVSRESRAGKAPAKKTATAKK